MPDKKPETPFFVGYLPMPRALVRFYLPLVVLLITASGFAGYWGASQQKPAGPAHWDTTHTTTLRGVLTIDPYPVLHRIDPHRPGNVESVLLVSQGKHSAEGVSGQFHRRPVAIQGNAITRGGWTMLEIADADAIAFDTGAEDQAAAIAALLPIKPLGKITLQGEIADSKCFLGVMKPGAGRVHKACAELCLRGGIPPMLIAADTTGQKFGYLLTQPDNSAAALAKFAAEKVQITGQLQQHGGLLYLRMDEGGIRRL